LEEEESEGDWSGSESYDDETVAAAEAWGKHIDANEETLRLAGGDRKTRKTEGTIHK
jgi:hypothetical protein